MILKFRVVTKDGSGFCVEACEEETINLETGQTVKHFTVKPGVDAHISLSTGLKDKNGTEIYEGDILSFDGNMTADNSFGCEPNGYVYDETSIHQVGWNTELALWEPVFQKDEEHKYKRDTRFLMVDGEVEIIGNVYENPEMLEGK